MTIRTASARPGLSPLTRTALWGTIAILLLTPAVAMQFTPEVNWGPEDFLAAAAMLGLTGLGLELTFRFATTPLRRGAIAGGIVLALLLVWAELAVGIFS